jgi:putative acetyltransferase
MLTIKRTDARDSDFLSLVKELDADLAEKDGEDHEFYSRLNVVDDIKEAVVAYEENVPIACGAIRFYEHGAVEVKRMYTVPEQRGKGIAMEILRELEAWAKELGYERTVLETGKRQPAAIALYLKTGYVITENYGKYVGIDNSVCFSKQLT